MQKPKKSEPTDDYIVGVREVHVQQVMVRGATSVEDAIKKAQAGEGEEINNTLEYSHTLDPETWTAEKAKKEKK